MECAWARIEMIGNSSMGAIDATLVGIWPPSFGLRERILVRTEHSVERGFQLVNALVLRIDVLLDRRHVVLEGLHAIDFRYYVVGIHGSTLPNTLSRACSIETPLGV